MWKDYHYSKYFANLNYPPELAKEIVNTVIRFSQGVAQFRVVKYLQDCLMPKCRLLTLTFLFLLFCLFVNLDMDINSSVSLLGMMVSVMCGPWAVFCGTWPILLTSSSM